MNEGALKAAIHRLRKRFRELVEAEIAHTVANPATAATQQIRRLRWGEAFIRANAPA